MKKSSISNLFNIRIILSVLDNRTLGFVCLFSDALFAVNPLGYLCIGLNRVSGRRTPYRYLWAGTGTLVLE